MNVIQDNDKLVFSHEHGRAVGTEFPDCTASVFMSGFSVEPEHRGKGLGSQYHVERLEWFKKNTCVSDLFCLVYKDNEPERKILVKNGWNPILQGVVGYMTLWHKKL